MTIFETMIAHFQMLIEAIKKLLGLINKDDEAGDGADTPVA